MLVIFPLVIMSSFWGISGGDFLYSLCRLWGNIWLPSIGIFHQNIYESSIEDDKHYVFIANHISFMDIPVIFQAIRRKHFRILGKIEMSKVPLFGFLYKNATIMVDRSSVKKRAESIIRLKKILHQNISIFIYPEGTFNETHKPLKSFYDGAFRLAIETQTPLKPIIFLDTYKRLHYKSIFSLTPGKCRAVILPEIAVKGLGMNDIDALKNSAYTMMENCLLRYLAPHSNS